MSKYCMSCGAELTENAMFCQKCGTPVQGIRTEETSPIKSKGALNANLITAIIAAAMILITLIIIVVIILSGKKSEQKILDRIESKSQSSADNQDIEDIEDIEDMIENLDLADVNIDDIDLEDIEKAAEESKSNKPENDDTSTKEDIPEETIPEDEANRLPDDAFNTDKIQRMTEDEFTLCWYNDQYLGKIPLMGLGTYETIVQAEKYSTAIISDISRDDVKSYCEQTGSEGSLYMNGFNANPKRVADTKEKYAYQVSNKDGVTAYIVWSENVALFTVGVE